VPPKQVSEHTTRYAAPWTGGTDSRRALLLRRIYDQNQADPVTFSSTVFTEDQIMSRNQYLEAYLIQAIGTEQDPRCNFCADSKGPFTSCRSVGEAQGCAGCRFQQRTHRCSLNTRPPQKAKAIKEGAATPTKNRVGGVPQKGCKPSTPKKRKNNDSDDDNEDDPVRTPTKRRTRGVSMRELVNLAS